jgi:hypothetical protein
MCTPPSPHRREGAAVCALVKFEKCFRSIAIHGVIHIRGQKWGRSVVILGRIVELQPSFTSTQNQLTIVVPHEVLLIVRVGGKDTL